MNHFWTLKDLWEWTLLAILVTGAGLICFGCAPKRSIGPSYLAPTTSQAPVGLTQQEVRDQIGIFYFGLLKRGMLMTPVPSYPKTRQEGRPLDPETLEALPITIEPTLTPEELLEKINDALKNPNTMKKWNETGEQVRYLPEARPRGVLVKIKDHGARAYFSLRRNKDGSSCTDLAF